MKKVLLFVLLVISSISISQSINAQSMYFCESVDADGYPISASSTFNIGSSGGYLDILVRLPYTIECTTARFEIYKVDGYGNETYDNTIYQDVGRDWVWFWKQVTFYKGGAYNVYAYDCNNYLLASGQVIINVR